MELKFVAVTKPATLSDTVKRRQRLVQRIDQQIAFIDVMKSGHLPRAAWAWMDESGSYFLPIKYGRQLVELKKGKHSILCKDVAELEDALRAVRNMVLAGELDLQLAKASADIRNKFSGASEASANLAS